MKTNQKQTDSNQSLLKKWGATNERLPHILVIDDDPTFRSLVKSYANSKNLSITICGSFNELATMATPELFDVVVIDYYLDSLKEYLNGAEIANVFGPTPVILISSTDRCVDEGNPWPQSIRKFLNKKAGVEKILNTALEFKRLDE